MSTFPGSPCWPRARRERDSSFLRSPFEISIERRWISSSGLGPPEHGVWDAAFYARTQAVYTDEPC